MIILLKKELATIDDLLSTQTKTECISTKEIGLPFGGKIVLCDGWATYKRFYRNVYSGQVVGPDGTDEYVAIAERCLPVAISAAYATWVLTPGEAGIKSGAAWAAGNMAFLACVGATSLRFEIVHSGDWIDWVRV